MNYRFAKQEVNMDVKPLRDTITKLRQDRAYFRVKLEMRGEAG